MSVFVVVARAVSISLAVASAGQQTPPREPIAPSVTREVLESIAQLECAFTVVAAGRWSGASPTVRMSTLSEPMGLTLFDISVPDASATSRSAGRTSSVSVRSDQSNLYFLDGQSDGVISLTTVFAQTTATGRLKAVHTRTGQVAEQFYGDCGIAKPPSGRE